jgi:hypothetical protein
MNEPFRRSADVVHGGIEHGAIALGGLLQTADFADVLKCRGADLIRSRRWLEVVEDANVAAHVA